MEDEFLASRSGGVSDSERSFLKMAGVIEFPKATEKAFDDLHKWLTRFDSVVQHVYGNRGLTAADRTAHFLLLLGLPLHM